MKRTKTSSQYLTYPHAAYFGCTVGEMVILSSIYIGLDFLFAVIIALFVGYFFLIFLVLFVLSYFFIRLTATFLGQFKLGRQHNYIILNLQKWLHQHLNCSIPFVTREGYWITRRHL